MNVFSSPPQKLDDLNYVHKPNNIVVSPMADKRGPATGATTGTATGTGRSTNNSTGLGFILASPKGSTMNSSPTTARMREKNSNAFAAKPNITSVASTTSLLKMTVSTKQLPRNNSSGHIVAS